MYNVIYIMKLYILHYIIIKYRCKIAYNYTSLIIIVLNIGSYSISLCINYYNVCSYRHLN